MKKIYNNIMPTIVLIQPIIDILTSYMSLNGYSITIGMVIKIIMLGLFILYLLFIDKNKYNKYILLFISIFSIFNIINNIDIIKISLVTYFSYLIQSFEISIDNQILQALINFILSSVVIFPSPCHLPLRKLPE